MHPRINFNEDTLNIFTDSSVKTMEYGFDSASAIVALMGDKKVLERVELNRNTTNNYGEIRAIYMGVESAEEINRYFKPKYINIFSDSRISVLGLKEWYKKWDVVDEQGYSLSSSGNRVANQSVIWSIIRFILNNNLHLAIYHVRGHINPNQPGALKQFVHSMRVINKDIGSGLIDEDDLRKLIEGNDYADRLSRDMVRNSEKYPFILRPIERLYNFTPEEIKKYGELIDPRYQI